MFYYIVLLMHCGFIFFKLLIFEYSNILYVYIQIIDDSIWIELSDLDCKFHIQRDMMNRIVSVDSGMADRRNALNHITIFPAGTWHCKRIKDWKFLFLFATSLVLIIPVFCTRATIKTDYNNVIFNIYIILIYTKGLF